MGRKPCRSWYAAIALGASLVVLGPLAAQSLAIPNIHRPSLQADIEGEMFDLDPNIRDTAIQAASVYEIETLMPENQATLRNVVLIETGHVHTESRYGSNVDFYVGNEVTGFGDIEFTASGITADVILTGPDDQEWIITMDSFVEVANGYLLHGSFTSVVGGVSEAAAFEAILGADGELSIIGDDPFLEELASSLASYIDYPEGRAAFQVFQIVVFVLVIAIVLVVCAWIWWYFASWFCDAALDLSIPIKDRFKATFPQHKVA